MGKRVIVAADGPGFLVNRCGRPFGAEALRLVQERVATPEQVDRICRLGGGFRMGPFELMDLVGIDVGYAVAQSFDRALLRRAALEAQPAPGADGGRGRLGRKTGPRLVRVRRRSPPAGGPAGPGRDGSGLRGGGRRGGTGAVCGATLASLADPALVGFHLLPGAGLVELTRGPAAPAASVQAAEEVAAAAGLHHEWVGDAPGLVLGRMAACLVNEAAFAIGEGVGSAEDVDAGLELGLNYPRGPVDGARRSAWHVCSRRSTASGPSAARSATARRRCCAAPWRSRWASRTPA